MTVSAREQIDIAAAMVRLYVFLAQYLDRCFDDAARKSYPDADLHAHLTDTRRQLMDILEANPVVKAKLAQECDRILSLGNSCLKGNADATTRETIRTERTMLQHKTIALSDVVAVFRALE
jgi:hypothetical protein